MRRLIDLPLLVILMGIGALAMLVPAAHAAAIRDWHTGRAFLFPALLFLMLTGMVGMASVGGRVTQPARSHLLALLGTFTLLPMMLAVPFAEAVRNTGYYNAWWEMVSSLTTTGASLFDPQRLPASAHLWRALVGWLGGFFMLVAGISILAPMNLGGFEVLNATRPGAGEYAGAQSGHAASERLVRHTLTLLPVYGGLTLILWAVLVISGQSGFVAACHAMATLSTSGISPVGGLSQGGGGFKAEALVFLFLFLALSRRIYPDAGFRSRPRELLRDPEIAFGLALVLVVPGALFLRHWIGALEVDEVQDFRASLEAAWGSVFTVMSFLTTTGFESAGWTDARVWSGLSTPGLVLAGLAIIGGGVATTAGGVKLYRVYALYRHGERELEKLVHPNSVGGSGAVARRLRREGAQIAWVFFALFALSIAVTMLALSLAGLNFTQSTVMSIAALSNTGPLAAVAAEQPLSWAAMGDGAKSVLAAAMVLGRLETLAIIALLNPEMWRQ